MKKVIFAMFIALASTLAFTSCSSSDDSDLALSDLAGYTFSGKDGSDVYAITFAASAQTFSFASTISGTSATSTGTYSLSGTNVVLTYSDAKGTQETLTSNGSKKLVYALDSTTSVTLERE